MGTGPVDTAVVQCNTKYGSGGDNPGFFTIDFNGATGVAQFVYDTESIKDEMEVNAEGLLLIRHAVVTAKKCPSRSHHRTRR